MTVVASGTVVDSLKLSCAGIVRPLSQPSSCSFSNPEGVTIISQGGRLGKHAGNRRLKRDRAVNERLTEGAVARIIRSFQPSRRCSGGSHMERILEIKNATVYRGQRKVFDALSLEIPLGCHTVILGPNGAGKSTLLKLLTRELYPVRRDGSYVRVFGREHWNVWDLRMRLGIVSHELHHRYLGHVRGMDVVLSGFYASIGTWPRQRFHAEQIERAEQLMAMLGVAALGDTPFAEMSAGEQRRFLLARALVHDPEALILDEPMSGLDLRACFQYLDLVRRLMREGKTVILVTHRIHEIPPEVSRVVLLKEGRVLADGAKDRVLTSENLSRLFDIPLELVQRNGFYQVLPASR